MLARFVSVIGPRLKHLPIGCCIQRWNRHTQLVKCFLYILRFVQRFRTSMFDGPCFHEIALACASEFSKELITFFQIRPRAEVSRVVKAKLREYFKEKSLG